MPLQKIFILFLLLLTAWLFWREPLAVPPGLEMDELIEAQIAEQVLAGDWRPFYEAGQGREGLYYYWLAPWLKLMGQHRFSLRLASTTITLLGLSAITTLLRRLFGSTVAIISLAYAGTSFWLIFAARSGLRSTGLLLPAALAALFFWQGLERSRASSTFSHTKWFLLSGLCLGLTVYSYTAARILPFVFILFVLYLLLWRRDWLQGQWGNLAVMAGATAVLILPFFFYLQAHPQLDQFDFMDFNRPLAALQSGDPQPALQTTWQTLGMFISKGDPLIFDNIPDRPIFNLANAVLFLTGIGLALWRSRHQPAYTFILIWLIISLIPGMLSQPAPNFYRTVAAQLVTFAFPALAIASLPSLASQLSSFPPRLPHPTYGLLLTLLIGSQFLSNWQAYFQEWPQVEGVAFFWQRRLAQTAVALQNHPTDQPITLCTSLIYEQDPWWRPAWQSMPYLLSNTPPIRYYDCRAAFVLPATESFLTIYPDEIPQHEWWPLLSLEQATPLPDLTMAWEVTAAVVPDIPAPQPVTLAPEAGGQATTLPVTFGEGLRLLGYEYGEAEDGRLPTLITVWEVTQPLPPRLALFTHIMSDPQSVIAQQDGLPISSHTLQPGDRFWVRHNQIWRPAAIPDEALLVAIGLYNQDTAVRLPLQPGGDRLFLQPIPLE